MASNKGRAGNAKKQYYAGYDPIKNRRIKLQRLLKEQPNNDDIVQALKNVHTRGPRVPKEKHGWIDRRASLTGFASPKKEDNGNLYDDISGPADARARAKMAKHVRDVERRHQHSLNFKSKKK